VPEVGVEPTWGEAPQDFKSRASTSSATPARRDYTMTEPARTPPGEAARGVHGRACSTTAKIAAMISQASTPSASDSQSGILPASRYTTAR
jgi:hypothetical protein